MPEKEQRLSPSLPSQLLCPSLSPESFCDFKPRSEWVRWAHLERFMAGHSPTQCSKPREVIGVIDPVPDGDDLLEAFHLDAQNLKTEHNAVTGSQCFYLCCVT